DVLQGDAGNPSGPHGPARRARRQLDDARDVIADVIGASPAEVVFTSGGTEADNLAIRGAGRSPGSTARHTHTGSDEARVASETSGDGYLDATVLTGATEHSAVREPVLAEGGEVLPVDTDGVLDLDALAERLHRAAEGRARPVRLVSIMAVNNETGARNDLAAI